MQGLVSIGHGASDTVAWEAPSSGSPWPQHGRPRTASLQRALGCLLPGPPRPRAQLAFQTHRLSWPCPRCQCWVSTPSVLP